ncbi:flagellin [Psychromonas sp. SP041]|uniref:flagellin N-terminal helical domain-containing protein n=1 Tax=Psychromonas sp. SP041 TaxID=1365007 RepID=UPI0004094DA2|nr:flagellin [Psychromonas sp. SP041]
MASVVNTNVMSLNAQRQLGKTQMASNEAMERLSSGLRINSAKDDAAGLAISTNMNSQITGLNQAVRNSNDGISMAQTAEGAMDEMTNILQRMRELSVQSANDTNSAENRGAIQEEVDQLHQELDRIADTTEFNGKKLLDGTMGSTTLQIGANEGQTLSFSIDSVTTNDLGLNGGLNKDELNSGRVTAVTTGTAGDLLINGVDVAASDSASATDIAKAINLDTAESGVTASAYNVVQGDHESTTVDGITSGMSIQVGTGAAVELGATSSMDNLVETINRDVEGVNASIGDDGELIMTNDTGEDITVAVGTGGDIAGSGIAAGTYSGYLALDSVSDEPIAVTGTAAGLAVGGFEKSNGADSMVVATAGAGAFTDADALTINGVEIAASTAASPADIAAHINSYSDQTGVTLSADALTFSAEPGKGIEIGSNAATQTERTAALAKLGLTTEMGGKQIDSLGTNVSTMAGASSTITKVDDALAQISASRAGLGAIQNRLDSTISNLENVSQNLSASNSRIQDADFAAETSNMSKAQILQQAGTSILSQANSSAQSVLSLLG